MDLTTAIWRKSSYSSANGGQCVEIALNLPSVVAIQDSKNLGPALVISPASFVALTEAIKAGDFHR